MDASAVITRAPGKLIPFPARPVAVEAPDSPEHDPRIVEAVRSVFASEVKPILDMYLADISFRIGQEYELAARGAGKAKGTVYAEDLNLQGRHMLTGYTVTPNSPGAGSFAWADLHVVYNGTDYPITNGNTNLKYAWWSPTTTPTVMQTSNTKPVLAQGEVLIFMNNSGTPKVMLSDTNQSLPGVVGDGAVDTSAILANAVTAAAIADGAVGSNQLGANAVVAAKLADGAVGRTGQLAGNVVTHAAIAANAIENDNILANAVNSSKIADGSIGRTAQMAANVVTTTTIADSAVTTNQLGANAVNSSKIADGSIGRTAQMANGVVATATIAANAVDSTKVADGAVVRSGQLGANVVDNGKIADNAIGRAGQLAANVVGAGKIADSAINRSGILSANVVTSAAVADNALNRAAQLAANVVTNNALANNAVATNNIVTGAVGATKLDILRHVLY